MTEPMTKAEIEETLATLHWLREQAAKVANRLADEIAARGGHNWQAEAAEVQQITHMAGAIEITRRLLSE